MRKLLGIIIVCLMLAALACESQGPRMAVIEFDGAQDGQGLWPEIEKHGNICTAPYDGIKNRDGSTFYLRHGMEVEFLEDSGCTHPKAGLVKIRVPGFDIVGWTFADVVRLK